MLVRPSDLRIQPEAIIGGSQCLKVEAPVDKRVNTRVENSCQKQGVLYDGRHLAHTVLVEDVPQRNDQIWRPTGDKSQHMDGTHAERDILRA